MPRENSAAVRGAILMFVAVSAGGLGTAGGLAACAGTAYEDDAGLGDRPDADLPDAAERPDADPSDADVLDAADAPDATVLTIDAAPPDAPPPPDAAPGAPDACVPTTQQLLTNPGFDSGPGGGWTQSSSGGVTLVLTAAQIASELGGPFAVQSPTYAAWMGGYPLAKDVLVQTVTIPAGTTSLRLRGYRWIASAEIGAGVFDKLSLELLNQTGSTVLETFGGAPTFSDNDTTTTWTPFELTATGNYAGQTVQLRLSAVLDGLDNTNFFLDSLALEASVCP